jgi:hypothetical protein
MSMNYSCFARMVQKRAGLLGSTGPLVAPGTMPDERSDGVNLDSVLQDAVALST